jgi:hypothetical protein
MVHTAKWDKLDFIRFDYQDSLVYSLCVAFSLGKRGKEE